MIASLSDTLTSLEALKKKASQHVRGQIERAYNVVEMKLDQAWFSLDQHKDRSDIVSR